MFQVQMSMNGLSLTVMSFTIVFLFHGVGGGLYSGTVLFRWELNIATFPTLSFQDPPLVFEKGKLGDFDDLAGDLDHHPAVHLPPPGDHLVPGLEPQLPISPSHDRHLVSPSPRPPAHETYHDGSLQQVQE